MNRYDIAARDIFVRGLKRIASHASQYWQLFVLRDPQTVWVHKWYRDQGDQALRYDYPLAKSSVVFDLGGYEGSWAAEIHKRYHCHVFVFEPVPHFFEGIKSRFSEVEDIHVFDFGLADTTRIEHLTLGADGSSVYREEGPRIQIRLVDIQQFLHENSIETIDLVKINIEGAEYDLLEHMIAKGITQRCTDIQIQFHRFVPQAETRRNTIRNALNETHYLTYDYPFVWENWRRREAGLETRLEPGTKLG
jgi:FkbM family methyltransferase